MLGPPNLEREPLAQANLSKFNLTTIARFGPETYLLYQLYFNNIYNNNIRDHSSRFKVKDNLQGLNPLKGQGQK